MAAGDKATSVWFHVLVDISALGPGDVVTIRGNIPELGAWDQGVLMEQSPLNPAIWSANVVLPFLVTDKKHSGLFQFKYAIENNGQVDHEGQTNRIERKLLLHYFHTFRPDFRGRRRMTHVNRDAVEAFLRNEVEAVMTEAVSPEEFLDRVDGISECIPAARRNHAEVVFDSYVKDHGSDLPLIPLLCLCGAVGSFGLSSKDPLRYTRQTMTRNAIGGTRYTYSRRKVEKPKPWCWHILHELPLLEVLQLDMPGVFGGHRSWVTRGVAEAVERASSDRSYAWLRVMPFLDRHNVRPNTKGAPKSEFEEAAAEIRALANDAMETAAAERANRPADEKGEPASLDLARSWLATLVRHAPHIPAIIQLFDGELGQHAEMLTPIVANRIEEFTFRTKKDFDAIVDLTLAVPVFRTPTIAAALLHNTDSDNRTGDTLEFTAMCLADVTDEVIDAVRAGDQAVPPFLSSGLADLNTAAKDWFRRNHESREDDDAGGADGGFLLGGLLGSRYSAPRVKSDAELDADLRRDMMNGVLAANSLLRINYFARARSTDILFELGRCHFFRGEPFRVLRAVCGLCFDLDVAGNWTETLRDWMYNKARSLVETVGAVVASSPGEVRRVLEVITNNLTRGFPMTANLVHTLAVVVSVPCNTNPALPPCLASIVSRVNVWDPIFSYAGTTRADWADGTQLGVMLGNVHDTLAATATAIESGAINLHDLHTVLNQEGAFSRLVAILGINFETTTLTSARGDVAGFDSTFEKLQCYVSFYCNCGVPIESNDLRDLVDDITRRYDSITLADVRSDMFAYVDVLPFLPWLFTLRKSNLFFGLWRNIGMRASEELSRGPPLDGGRRPRRGGGDGGDGEGDDGEDEFPLDDWENIEDEFGGDGGPDDSGMMAAIVMTQEVVMSTVLPFVQAEWCGLMRAVQERSITIEVLGETFANLKSVDECRREVELLAATGDPDNPNPPIEWVVEVLPALADYLFLLRVSNWIPSTLALCSAVQSLLETTEGEDPHVALLRTEDATIKAEWDLQTLNTVSGLVDPVKALFADFSDDQLEFLSTLGSAPELVTWLLEHASTDEFNRLLQVVRSSTDEARLLSLIASLVHIRTLLLGLLYSGPPYSDLQHFLNTFRGVSIDGDQGLQHLRNIVVSFETLMEVFEKKTRSPGVKSCYDLRDIKARGVFVLSAVPDADEVLSLEIKSDLGGGTGPSGTATGAGAGTSGSGPAPPPGSGAVGAAAAVAVAAAESGAGDDTRTEPLEYLLDLRSKLMMTEIPAELEAELGISALVDAFVLQLEVLVEMRSVVIELHEAGHFAYQEGCCVKRFPFDLDGLPAMEAELERLRADVLDWNARVKAAREEHYFLNFFSMRELQWLNVLLCDINGEGAEADPGSMVGMLARRAEKRAANAAAREAAIAALLEEQEREAAMREAAARDALAAAEAAREAATAQADAEAAAAAAAAGDNEWVCSACTFINATNVTSCAVCDTPSAAAVAAAQGVAAQANTGIGPNTGGVADFMAEFAAATAAAGIGANNYGGGGGGVGGGGLEAAAAAAGHFDDDADEDGEADSATEFAALLHLVRSTVVQDDIDRGVALWREQRAADVADKADDDAEIDRPLKRLGAALAAVFGGVPPPYRTCRLPSETASNRADLLVPVVTGEGRSVPMWVTTAQSKAHVIDVVTSVYLRRGRLPEPSEIVFCTATTPLEDIELLVRRFLRARANGHGDHVFCVADLHALSYTTQCKLVQFLRDAFAEYGTDDASTLLFVSGEPRQVVINSFPNSTIDLPPLDTAELLNLVSDAFATLSFETMCVTSSINGGGKTHHIMSVIGNRQRDVGGYSYRRIPFRESSTEASLLSSLAAVSSVDTNAFHIDIGHILPVSPNTLLFSLLLVGVLRDSKRCRVYHRRPADMYLLEIPNSIRNRTARALRFCCFIPNTHLQVDSVDLRRPMFANGSATQIVCPEYSELVLTCRFLRAMNRNKFLPGEGFDPGWEPYTDDPLSEYEAYTLLLGATTALGMSPSYIIFHNFVHFMNHQFTRLESFPIFAAAVYANLQGLESFKSVFVNLLILTSKDFSLRNVPQVEGIGVRMDEVADVTPTPSAARGGGDFGFPAAIPGGGLDGGDGRDADDQAAAVAREGEDLAGRFRSMISWEHSEHPIVIFYQSMYGADVSGLDVLSLNPEFVNNFFEKGLKDTLKQNGIDLNKDWRKLVNSEAIQMLRKVEGYVGSSREEVDPGYVITVDNLLKMLSIQLRLKYGLPVVISGETGCGKSSLISQLCAVTGARLRTLNVHGGIEDRDITDWVKARVAEAAALTDPLDYIVMFFDEVNTCNCMGLFKEMVCDGTMNGRPLPSTLKIIAACNPYRLKPPSMRSEERAGLVFEHHSGGAGASAISDDNVGTGIRDPLADLVYRVHPLPESMLDHVFDFGALSAQTERLYIKAILLRQIGVYVPDAETRMTESAMDDETMELVMRLQLENVPEVNRQDMFGRTQLTEFGEFVEVFAELICTSQEFVRAVHGGERSAVSLRDVARCIKVFRWFGEHFATTEDDCNIQEFFAVEAGAQTHVRAAVFLSLAYCYHARLSREERLQYRMVIADTWADLQDRPAFGGRGGGRRGGGGLFGFARQRAAQCSWLNLDAVSFVDVLYETQRKVVDHMNVGEGIAMNEALCENLFMILVSVLNQIPIFVIGKPGSSKSLAMELVQSNLNGDASDNAYLRALPAVEVFSYQCSPLSTSGGIEAAFDSARRYRREAPNTVVVVLLDEVGLAEQSPHLPLKVLHKVLDEGAEGEAVVGISNWTLDPAKMNRAVHLYRPAPTVEDLSLTAEGMVKSANLKGYLQSLAKAYSSVYHSQTQTDFWGLREFYATVRFINRALAATTALDADVLMDCVLRNFGGRPQELERVVTTFFSEVGMNAGRAARKGVVQLVRENIRETHARHLMLLTKNNAALSLLFDLGILAHDRTQVIFGSDFPLDQTDLQICLNIQRIKLCMAEGITVVLVHCESLYESLYDLLNQHYCEYGGQQYVRLAFGTHSRLCPIHREFRVVVVVEKFEAYTRLAPPLLNRFEKQIFERQHILDERGRRLVARLKAFANDFAAAAAGRAEGTGASMSDLRAAFCGWHADILSSLVLSVMDHNSGGAESEGSSGTGAGKAAADATLDTYFASGVAALLWLATPEAACRIISTPAHHAALVAAHSVPVKELYFSAQRHKDLPGFLDLMRLEHLDALGSQMAVLTYSPLSFSIVDTLSEHSASTGAVTHIVLHELSAERDLVQQVKDFFEDAQPGALLLVQCDPMAASNRRIEHAKYICENLRARHADAAKARVAAAAAADNGSAAVDVVLQPNDDEGAGVAAALADALGDSLTGEGGEATTPDAVDSSGAVADGESGGAADVTDAAAAASDHGVHVMFLIHLPRDSETPFSVDFDSRWRFAFVDAVKPSVDTGLPDIEELIGRSLVDIFDSLDVSKALLHNFRSALARLVFLHERTNEDVRAQITTLIACLQDPEFTLLLRDVLGEIVRQVDAEGALDVGASASAGLASAGTFRAALHRKIIDILATAFAIVLCHMERNSTLALYSAAATESDSEAAARWRYLFARSFDEMQVALNHTPALLAATGEGGGGRVSRVVEVKVDGAQSRPFTSRFPFSFYLSRVLEGMRGLAETSAAPAEIVRQQFGLLGFEFGLDGELPYEAIADYVADFACVHTLATDVLAQGDRGALVLKVLELVEPAVPLDTLAAVHARFWAAERTLQVYLEAMDAVPDSVSAVVRYVLTSGDTGPALHVGVARVVMAALSPQAQEWSSARAYGPWLGMMSRAEPYIVTLLDWATSKRGLDPSANLSDGEADMYGENLGAAETAGWSRLQFCAAFVRDVAAPLNLAPAHTLAGLSTVVGDPLGVTDSFRALVRIVSPGNAPPVTPSAASAGGVGDARVAAGVAASVSPAELESCASKLMEFFLFGYVLGDPSGAALTRDLVDDLLRLVSGSRLDIGGVAAAAPISDAGKVAVLRRLLESTDTAAAAMVDEAVASALTAAAVSAGHMDTPLAVLYMSVEEEKCAGAAGDPVAAAELVGGLDANVLAAAADVASLAASDSPVTAVEVLDTVARLRCALAQYAHVVAGDEGGSVSDEGAAQLGSALEPFLTAAADSRKTGTTTEASVQRSARMFLLRNLERARGLSYVRVALQSPPLADAAWLRGWKESGEMGLNRFLGHSRLPATNPFAALPLFGEVGSGLSAYLNTGDAALLDVLVATFGPVPAFRSALVANLFHEVFVLDAMPAAGRINITPKVVALRQWLKSSPLLDGLFTPVERGVLLLFAGELSDSAIAALGPSAAGFFIINEDVETERVLLLRALAGIAAAAFGVGHLALLRGLINDPGAASDSLLPAMPEDLQYMLQTVMGGHWYRCPNGHAYYVDNCGRPMEVLHCMTCGVEIGGHDHNLLDTNVDMGTAATEEKTAKGFCLSTAEEEAKETYFTVRELTPTGVRFQRILLLGSMLLGAAGAGTPWTASVVPLFNTEYSRPGRDIAGYLLGHFQSEWGVLAKMLDRRDDDVSMALHLGLNALCNNDAGLLGGGEVGVGLLVTNAQRTEWENTITRIAGPQLDTDGLGARLAIAESEFSGAADEGSLFTSELQQKFSMASVEPAVRAAAAPALFSYRRPFSLDHFEMALNLDPASSTSSPTLLYFLSKRNQLAGLSYLPGALHMVNLLYERYNRRITKEEARETTIGDAIAAVDEGERAEWQASFDAFAGAWTTVWEFVQYYGCLVIPADFKAVECSLDLPLSFMLVKENDEGICTLALLRFIVGLHNELVQLLDEHALLRGRETQRSETTREISSRFMTQSHAIAFDMDEITGYIQQQCLEYDVSGDMAYSFTNAEQFLVDRYLSFKPLVNIELRICRFLNEEVRSEMSLLRGKLHQEELPVDAANSLKEEFANKSRARQVLDVLETCAAFLHSTGGSLVQSFGAGVTDMKLADYMANVLMMEDTSVLGPGVSQHVLLKHIDALFALIEDTSMGGAFGSVNVKYQDTIDEAVAEQLRAAAPDLHLSVLLPNFREFIVNFLCDDAMSANASVKDVLGYVDHEEMFLNEYEWFEDNFPSELTLSCALEAYKLLESVHRADSST